MKVWVLFYTDKAIPFLNGELSACRIDHDQAQLFQLVLDEDHKSSVKEFNQMVKEYFRLDMPVEINHQSNRLEELQRESATLFDLTCYIQEVELLYQAAGKPFISWSQLHYLDRSDRVNEQLRNFVFSNFERGYGTSFQYDKDQVIQDITNEWDNKWAGRLYLFIKNNIDWVPEAVQLSRITDWVTAEAPNIDFTKAFDEWDYKRVEENIPSIIISFFIRYFNIKTLDESIYLDLLVMQRWSDNAPDIFDFVNTVLPFTAIEGRVLQNFHEKQLSPVPFSNHLKFILNNSIIDAASLLITYLENNSTYQWEDVLSTYRSLNGELDKLQHLFPLLNSSHHNQLVIAFIEEEAPFIGTYLESRLTAETDAEDRLTTAKFLIRLQKRAGLREYYNFMQRTKTVPDYSAPGNPLYYVYDLGLFDITLELVELAYDPALKYNLMSNPRSITMVMLRNIAFNDGAFPEFQNKMDAFITRNKNLQVTEFSDSRQKMLEEMDYFYENLQHQYSLTDSAPVDLQESIIIADSLLLNN